MRTSATLVSAGTERMLVEFARANLLSKARKQPGRLREVLDKARAEGISETIDAVRGKLAQPVPLGYANAGVIVAVGDDVHEVSLGDLVACNGPHAEVVAVPVTLVAKVPVGVPADNACFATVAAVGLQGIRLARAELGEVFAVTGLGLVGLLTAQLLLAQGCRVLGIDPDEGRRHLADSFGVVAVAPGDAESTAASFTRGRGVDGVLVCASTPSSDPLRAAARMCRQRGRVVLIGVTGLDLDRAELYEKEISVQVSASYGPGRYDPSYEAGNDLPMGLVRWTAGRNMEAVLDLMSSGRLDIAPLITHRVPFADAESAYDALIDDRSVLGIILDYEDTTAPVRPMPRRPRAPTHLSVPTPGRIAVIGAGNYATRTLLPAIKSVGGEVAMVVARNGISAQLAAERVGAAATTDLDAVLADPTIGVVFVATRHDSHPELAQRVLRAGKAAYVEKPLALTSTALDELAACVTELGSQDRLPLLTVGFNRRHAPITRRMRSLLRTTAAPKAVVMTINAGVVPRTHWTVDPHVGGGRIAGEACHFIDLARDLVGQPIEEVETHWLRGLPNNDAATIALSFVDGSSAQIHYLSNGSPRFPKERIEVICDGRIMVNANFRRLHLYGWSRRTSLRPRRLDKGHASSISAFLDAARIGGPPLIPWPELLEVCEATIAASRHP